MRLYTPYIGENRGFSKRVRSVVAGDIVSLSDVKNFARITTTDDDTLLAMLISSAEIMVEQYAAITLRTTEFTFEYESFAARIDLPYSPIVSIDEVRTKKDGVEQVLTADQYRVVGQDNSVLYVMDLAGGGIEIDLTAGYGADSVPADIKEAIMKIVLSNYDNRENFVDGSYTEMPNSAKSILNKRKDFFFI